MQDDRRLVLAAVQQNGRALEWASDKLIYDREVVLAAVKQTGWALKYASEELRCDPYLQSWQSLTPTQRRWRKWRDLVAARCIALHWQERTAKTLEEARITAIAADPEAALADLLAPAL